MTKECDHESHLTPWEIFRLNVDDRPTTCQAQLEMKEKTEYGVGGEAIVDNVSIGDNVVIPCGK